MQFTLKSLKQAVICIRENHLLRIKQARTQSVYLTLDSVANLMEFLLKRREKIRRLADEDFP
ncbi:hypothetical protein C0J52_05395 [Blattella germanica]|nr:hypothetical protein C0J52_05395 [Blattella germanica]